MGHYAKVDQGKVVDVIVADAEFIENFVDTIPGEWIKTSYNTFGGVHYDQNNNPDDGTALRYNYAGVGMLYDAEADAFYEPKPDANPSWVLNTDTYIWEPPSAKPDDGQKYVWNEEDQTWDLVTE